LSPVDASDQYKESAMMIGDRLRRFREAARFSQKDIVERTGLMHGYVSRVENGHTIPSIETLEKFARALEVPLYQLFYDSDEPPALPELSRQRSTNDVLWGSSGKAESYLTKFRQHLSRMDEDDRRLLLLVARKISMKRSRASKLPGETA
jgi:transcriptional regulator with XRE-family HTH domain